MNAVEIEEAVSALAGVPFDPAAFPLAFLEAFGNKPTTLKRLRAGTTNASDVGGLLQRGNVHLKVAPPGRVAETLAALRDSPATARQKAKFILATDGQELQAEQLVGDVPPLACAFADLPNHFAFFLPLAGITTVRQIAENAFDIRATGRLNRLYVELLKTNPDWDTNARREELNHFFARLIFCFFAEDTGIFDGSGLFTATVEQMTERDGSNTHAVLSTLFEAMNTPREKRDGSGLPASALKFPYVNGNLFAPARIADALRNADALVGSSGNAGGDAGAPRNADALVGSSGKAGGDAGAPRNADAPVGSSGKAGGDAGAPRNADAPVGTHGKKAGGDAGAPNYETPKFSKIARSYLLFVGGLDWKKINPDIFGSMIQAVADDEERGALGMHYTSVPNILKVLNPLFLDDLRQKLEEAGDGSTPASKGQLKRLRDRMARIRVFDPACGSGNFLVIAYIEMRKIEAVLNERRGERELPSAIPSTNFRGIEIRSFAAEIARLALIIARFQCDALHIGDLFARKQVLPLEKDNWITCENALRLDWLSVCPPTGTGVKGKSDDLFETPLDQVEMDFENEGGETYICGNPPYQGSVNQTVAQKDDMRDVFASVFKRYKDLDYVAAFLFQAARYNRTTNSSSAFVVTNSVTQGEQVSMLWPLIFSLNNVISFAHTSFTWSNLASSKAGVTCVVLGLTTRIPRTRPIISDNDVRQVSNISPYLVASDSVIVTKQSQPLSELGRMQTGNMPTDDGNFVLSDEEQADLIHTFPPARQFVRRYAGSQELINGGRRWCLWIDDRHTERASKIEPIRQRIERVFIFRKGSRGKQANDHANVPHRFIFAPHTKEPAIAIPKVSSIRREYLPFELTNEFTVVSNLASVIYGAPLWNAAIIASRLHLVWIGTVCGKLKTDYRYSNTLGWNTFPVPALSDQNKADLTRGAEEILLAREAHFPATIAELYDTRNAGVPAGSSVRRADGDVGVPTDGGDAGGPGMPADLRAAHDRNDETLERIYLGRRFKNDTERLETLFKLYTEMTARRPVPAAKGEKKRGSHGQ